MKTATLTKNSRKFVEGLIASQIVTDDADDLFFLARAAELEQLLCSSIKDAFLEFRETFDRLVCDVAAGKAKKAQWRATEKKLTEFVRQVGELHSEVLCSFNVGSEGTRLD